MGRRQPFHVGSVALAVRVPWIPWSRTNSSRSARQAAGGKCPNKGGHRGCGGAGGLGGGRRGGRVGFGRGSAGAVFRRNQPSRFWRELRPAFESAHCRHQHRLRSSGQGPSRRKTVHISNDSSVMLPSSFGITRWCRRAIHIPVGDLTHHCSLPSGRIIRP
jgi:hypothetical protein